MECVCVCVGGGGADSWFTASPGLSQTLISLWGGTAHLWRMSNKGTQGGGPTTPPPHTHTHTHSYRRTIRERPSDTVDSMFPSALAGDMLSHLGNKPGCKTSTMHLAVACARVTCRNSTDNTTQYRQYRQHNTDSTTQ